MTEKSDMPINPDITILDVVSAHQETIAVIKSFDEQPENLSTAPLFS